MDIMEKIDKYLVEAINKIILKANIKKKINKDDCKVHEVEIWESEKTSIVYSE